MKSQVFDTADRLSEIEHRLWFVLDALCTDDLAALGIETETATRLYYTLESIVVDLRHRTDELRRMV